MNADATRRVSIESEFDPSASPTNQGAGAWDWPQPKSNLSLPVGNRTMREVELNARLRIIVRSAVQGVGFRLFIYRPGRHGTGICSRGDVSCEVEQAVALHGFGDTMRHVPIVFDQAEVLDRG